MTSLNVLGSDSDSEDELPPLEDNSKSLKKVDLENLENLKEEKPLKKGFFDQPAPAPKKKPQKSTEGITELKGKKSSVGDKKAIPEFLKVEKDAATIAQEKMKSQLVDVLKPTPELMNDVQSNAGLMEGFDDPEVMAAVSEIAKDPTKFDKYKDNKKVQKFYSAMGMMMGEKLEKEAEKHPPPPTPPNSVPPAYVPPLSDPTSLLRSQNQPPEIREHMQHQASAQQEEEDSDEEMAEIMRSMNSNPFTRKKAAPVPSPSVSAPKQSEVKTGSVESQGKKVPSKVEGSYKQVKSDLANHQLKENRSGGLNLVDFVASGKKDLEEADRFEQIRERNVAGQAGKVSRGLIQEINTGSSGKDEIAATPSATSITKLGTSTGTSSLITEVEIKNTHSGVSHGSFALDDLD